MRKILTLACVVLGSGSIYAQGIVSCSNTGPGLNAPVTNAVTQQRVSGSGFLVQLYGGAAGANEVDLLPIGGVTTFLSGALAGYFNGGSATNNFVLPGSTGTFQARAWSAGFASFEAALVAAAGDTNILVGKSTTFQNSTGISSAQVLTGLRSFSIAPVPEPGVLALIILGGITMAWHNRRRR